jgi:hypothetical protein
MTDEIKNLERRKKATEEELANARESQNALLLQSAKLNQDKDILEMHSHSLEETIGSQQKTIDKLESDFDQTRGGNRGFEPILGARLETKVRIVEDDWGLDPDDLFEREIYPLVIASGEERFIIVPSTDLGFGWEELSETTGSVINEYRISLARRGENPVSTNFSGELEIMDEASSLALIRLRCNGFLDRFVAYFRVRIWASNWAGVW